MNTEQSSLNRAIAAADLNHHKFMRMANQVMAEFDKLDAIFAKCLYNADERKKAA